MRGKMSGFEALVLWAAFQPGSHQKPNIPALKEAVNDLCRMVTQKTAGQEQYAHKGDISWDNLERVKFTILCEAVILVLSGMLDKLPDPQEEGCYEIKNKKPTA